jgi:membrane protease YdiL (CAAX protease family)
MTMPFDPHPEPTPHDFAQPPRAGEPAVPELVEPAVGAADESGEGLPPVTPLPANLQPAPHPFASAPAADPLAGTGTPLSWADLIYLGLFYLGSGILLTLIVSVIAMFAFHVSLSDLRGSVGVQASVLIISQGLLSGATMAFLYVMIRGRTAAPFWPTVGWHTFRNAAPHASVAERYVMGGFGLALVVGILGRYVGGSSELPVEQMFRSRQSVLLLMALGILVAPLVEETIFRGVIYPVIAGKFGIATGVLVTGTLFGLAHAQQLGGAWGQISLLILVGITLTYIRARAGTVAASYFVHLGYNSILFAGFYFATGGLRHLPGS